MTHQKWCIVQLCRIINSLNVYLIFEKVMVIIMRKNFVKIMVTMMVMITMISVVNPMTAYADRRICGSDENGGYTIDSDGNKIYNGTNDNYTMIKPYKASSNTSDSASTTEVTTEETIPVTVSTTETTPAMEEVTEEATQMSIIDQFLAWIQSILTTIFSIS